jgi:hypothetical protein
MSDTPQVRDTKTHKTHQSKKSKRKRLLEQDRRRRKYNIKVGFKK